MSRLLLLCAVLALAGCSTYKMDLPQGNIVSAEAVARLKPGMSRAQVRAIVGPPTLVDPFRTDRWDYINRSRINGEFQPQTRLTLWFEGEQLKRWESVPPLPATPAATQP